MKTALSMRSTFFPVLLRAVVLVCLSACAGGPSEKPSDFPGYKTLELEHTILLYPGQGKSPRMIIHASLLDTDKPEEPRNLLRRLLYNGVGPEDYFRALTAHYESQYTGMASAQDLSDSGAMNWNYAEETRIETLSSGAAVISRDQDYYLGGAHGMREKTYFVISLEENEALKLEDLLRPGTEAELGSLLEDALRSYAKLQKGEPLSAGGFFEDTVEIPGNFFLSPGGLGFHWDPYEIAPYVMGSIEVIIPAEAVLPLLNSRGSSLGIFK
jgi:hypothetical protein